MAIAFVQLGDVWGDRDDALGLDAGLVAQVADWMSAGEDAIVVMPTLERAEAIDVSRLALSTPCVFTVADFPSTLGSLSEIVVVCVGARKSLVQSLDRTLCSSGFHRAGRAWGETGETRRYVRPRSVGALSRAVVAQARVWTGNMFVHARDHWFDPSRFASLRERVRVATSRKLSAADVVDDRYGRPYPPVARIDVRDVLPERFGIDLPPWTVSLEPEPDPLVVAHECHDRHGIWPISFSFPGTALPVLDDPSLLVAPVVPGLPYSFTDENTYLGTYQQAYLGLTHRKAGWDCFRHVEILASGAVPLMPDAAAIPGYSMVHYPKQALARAAEVVRATGGPPGVNTRAAFRDWFDRHLTSAAMARYLLQAAGVAQDARVLFVDERLPHHADYQSMLTLIGLKQVLGTSCDVMFPTDYIYEDTAVDISTLYGRGFGYTRRVAGSLRSRSEQGQSVDLADFDAVVVGSVTRNAALANDLLRTVPAARTIWIHGDDEAPPARHAHWMRSSGAHVFVRSINAGRPRSSAPAIITP